MLNTVIDALHGPYGGIVALAFGMGAASGYSFAMKTTLAEARKRIEELRTELDESRKNERDAYDKYVQSLQSIRDSVRS